MEQESFIQSDNKIAVFPHKLGIDDIKLVGKLEYIKAFPPLIPHFHSNILEICYLYRGHQSYVVNNKTYNLEGGDVFVTFPDEIHGTGANPEEKSVLYWVHVYIENSSTFLNLKPDDAAEIICALTNLPTRHFKGSPKLKALLEEFISVSKKEIPFKKIYLNTLITNFLLEILFLNSQTKKHELSEDIEKTIINIRQNITSNIEIKDLADTCNLSLSRFKQKFKQQTGLPPKEFIWREKILFAKTELTFTNKNITDIAMNLSFGTSQYFSEVFKRFTGITPNEYRKSTSRPY